MTGITIQTIRSVMEETCGLTAIYEAMDTEDLANVVRAARDSLKQSGYEHIRFCQKSAEESNKLRKEGNVQYVNEDYKQAILFYNKALAYAPINSLEMTFAYANTSAVMFRVKAYQACEANIKACHNLERPIHLISKKLNQRLRETEKNIKQDIRQMAYLHVDPVLNEYVKFDVPRNADVPCASKHVSVQNNDGCVKISAAKDIKSGTMVAMEKAFVSTQTEENQYISCYNCNKMSLCFIPCEGCCLALFCTKACKKQCMKDYHRIECQIIEYFGLMYQTPEEKLMTRAVIKLSLKLGWEELSVASRDIGEKRLANNTVKQSFDESNPISMLSYDDNKLAIHGKIFNGSIICAIIMDRLDLVPGYFPEGDDKRQQAVDAASRIMLKLYSTFTNRIEILCSALDYFSSQYRCGVQRNVGWFSFTSKLAHSCEPNLFVVGLNDRVALVTLQRIKKGDELTISYIDHFYDMVVLESATHSQWRQKRIMTAIQYFCDCRVCVQGWNSTSAVDGTLTQTQMNAYQKMIKDLQYGYISDQLKASSAALDALTGAINTKEHVTAYRKLRSALHLCQMRIKFNVTYAAESCV